MMPTAEALRTGETSSEPLEAAGQAAISGPDNHTEIAALAYEFWIQRGCPIGSPEEDWFRAEEELRNCKANVSAATA